MRVFVDIFLFFRGFTASGGVRCALYLVSPLYCIFCNDEVIISDIVDAISALYPPLCVARPAQSER
jgi:hypothetical protein